MNNMEIPEAYAKAEQIAKEAGFKLMAFADAATIELRQEVRDMCAANTCGKYGSNWACPPGCGDLDECRAKVAPYKWGIIVQTTGQMEDSFDFETVAEIAQEHDENFLKILEPMREAFPGMLALGAGTCNICAKCYDPDKCEDSRYLHRGKFDWAAAEKRHDPTTRQASSRSRTA